MVKEQATLDRINVFPVADADTGANLAATLTAAWPFRDALLTRIGTFDSGTPDVVDAGSGTSLTRGRRLGFDHLADKEPG